MGQGDHGRSTRCELTRRLLCGGNATSCNATLRGESSRERAKQSVVGAIAVSIGSLICPGVKAQSCHVLTWCYIYTKRWINVLKYSHHERLFKHRSIFSDLLGVHACLGVLLPKLRQQLSASALDPSSLLAVSQPPARAAVWFGR